MLRPQPEEPLMVTVYVTGGVLVMLWLVSPPHATWSAKLENIMLAKHDSPNAALF